MTHPTDSELQSYLDRPDDAALRHVHDHVLACDRCRRHMLAYRQVAQFLQVEAASALSPNFARVAARQVQAQVRSARRLEWFSYGALAIMFAGIIIYLGQLHAFSRILSGARFLLESLPSFAVLLAHVEGADGHAAGLLLLGGIALILAGLFDRFAGRRIAARMRSA